MIYCPLLAVWIWQVVNLHILHISSPHEMKGSVIHHRNLSCFLPICMPKVEVCVSSVSMFTFRLCCYFPPTCSSLSMPFPNNGNAKTRWRSSYCGPERKIWGQKGNYNHGSLTEWSGSEANSRTLIALFQFYKTSLTNFLDTLYLWNSKFAILKNLKIQLKKIITYPLTLQPITYPLPLLNK